MEPIDLVSKEYTFNITDGRVINGILIAIDDQSNLLITNATEAKGEGHFRELGLVSLKRETIEKVYMTKQEYQSIL